MVGLIVLFLILAIIAAIFGFGGIAGTAVNIAVILFWVFLALFIITLIMRFVSGGRAVGPTDL